MKDNTNKRGATRLLNFVKSYDPVARLVNDGDCVLIVCPETDLSGDFIRINVERLKNKLLIHDSGFTLSSVAGLAPGDLPELNAILDTYHVDPVGGRNLQLQTRTRRADYAERREDFCQAIIAVQHFCESRRR